jgi:hypothetical protein
LQLLADFGAVKRPRIYGNEARFRAALKRHISGAEELLDEAIGVRKRIEAVRETRHPDPIMAFIVEDEWEKHVRRWFMAAHQGLFRYLQEQFEEVAPVVWLGLPPDDHEPATESLSTMESLGSLGGWRN